MFYLAELCSILIEGSINDKRVLRYPQDLCQKGCGVFMAQDRVEAVERALTLLKIFGPDDRELTLADLAARTGYYKSTILRLTSSLERLGFFHRTPEGSFRLGAELFRLGSLYRREHDVGAYVRPVLGRLRDASGESASFYVRDGDERVCLYRANATREIRHHLDEGARLPLDRGAAGHVLRAFANGRGKRCAAIRKRGFDVSLGERDPDIAAVAVPLVTDDGALLGALALSGVATHFHAAFQTRCAKLLREAAAELAPRLGRL